MNRSFAALAARASILGAAVWLVALPALAALPKDAQAEKALLEAMDKDYLETRFDKAEKKLRAAIDVCGDGGCTPAVKARLFVALGSVLAGGRKQLEDAREAFVEALKLDKAVTPDPDIVSAEISFAFEQARKELKLGSAGKDALPALRHTPPAEQAMNTPVPLFVELGPELVSAAKKATVSYLAPGAPEWKPLVMRKLGEKGFGINVPCSDLQREGELRYHITVTDETGVVLATEGTRGDPLTTPIKQVIAGEPPRWPGFAPPEVCGSPVEISLTQCLDERQCNAGLSCVSGECRAKPRAPGAAPESARRDNLITFSLTPDVSFFSGEGVCTPATQESDHYVCLREDGSRYGGMPTPNIANNVNLGFSLSTLRAVLGYERVVLDNLTVGLRAGAAIAGPSHERVSFFRLSFEGRAAFYIGKKPFEQTTGVRPFVFVSGGAAQVNSEVDVQVLEDGTACGAANPFDPSSPCTVKPLDRDAPERRLQTLSAYKQAGLGFAGIGGGVSYMVMPRIAFNVSLRASLTFPVVTAVFSPDAGITVGF